MAANAHRRDAHPRPNWSVVFSPRPELVLRGGEQVDIVATVTVPVTLPAPRPINVNAFADGALDPDRVCVLGTALDFEKVGEDKSGFENIDNDFGVNLFIAPFPISDVAVKDPGALKRHMEKSPQGDLIQNPDAPEPAAGDSDPGPGPLKRKDDPSQNFGPMPSGFAGYERGLMISAGFPRPIPSNAYRDPHELVKVDPTFKQMGDDAYAAFAAEFQGEVIETGRPLP